jgi:hypothetical protein
MATTNEFRPTPAYDEITEKLGFSLESLRERSVLVGQVHKPRPITKRARHRITRLQNTILAEVQS